MSMPRPPSPHRLGSVTRRGAGPRTAGAQCDEHDASRRPPESLAMLWFNGYYDILVGLRSPERKRGPMGNEMDTLGSGSRVVQGPTRNSWLVAHNPSLDIERCHAVREQIVVGHRRHLARVPPAPDSWGVVRGAMSPTHRVRQAGKGRAPAYVGALKRGDRSGNRDPAGRCGQKCNKLSEPCNRRARSRSVLPATAYGPRAVTRATPATNGGEGGR
jgi:hypothetical protein